MNIGLALSGVIANYTVIIERVDSAGEVVVEAGLNLRRQRAHLTQHRYNNTKVWHKSGVNRYYKLINSDHLLKHRLTSLS